MKLPLCMMGTSPPPSPPSRGAWIEMISTSNTASALAVVAPLAGGVD